MEIPFPQKITINGTEVRCSVFNPGLSLNITPTEALRCVNGNKMRLPNKFIRSCKDTLSSFVPQIQNWFSPSPPKETIHSVLTVPDNIPCEPSSLEFASNVVIRVAGIIVENSKILPHIILDVVSTKTKSLTDSLSEPIDDVTDTLDFQDEDDAHTEDDEDEEDDDDDDAEDDEDDEERFERVQRNLDAAREELERLRRRRGLH